LAVDSGRGRAIAQPRIISRAEHPISRDNLSDSALKVLYRLKDAGYRSCLVGGGVRDLLLGVAPKDFDIATDASPEEVRRLFKNARLIGRRFRLAHVRFGREIIEVSTFRAGLSDAGSDDDDARALDDSGRILRDNVYGGIEDDARRRDFTINGLYYDIADFAIHDYVGGMEDVAARRLRLIGDPETRYREDPVRLLRAVRIAVKLDLDIDPASEAPIRRMGESLADVPAARLFDEILKALMTPDGVTVLRRLREYGLFAALFPDTAAALEGAQGAAGLRIIEAALANTGRRILEDRPVTPAFLYAALLWPAVQAGRTRHEAEGMPPAPALAMAQREVVARQVQRVTLPKRFAVPMREIWQLQPRFHKQRGKQPQRLMAHPRFRAAYDFLLLRAEAGEEAAELAQWWTDIQERSEAAAPAPAGRRRRRRRRGGQARIEE
jgi:poly(A) polymerase